MSLATLFSPLESFLHKLEALFGPIMLGFVKYTILQALRLKNLEADSSMLFYSSFFLTLLLCFPFLVSLQLPCWFHIKQSPLCICAYCV